MSRVNLKTRSGNRITVKFDGKEVGLVQSVRSSDDYAPDPASGIGDIHVQEYVPTMARHNLNVSTMVLKRNNLADLGISAENGDDMLRGVVFDIIQVDKDTGAEIRKYIGCSYASGDLEISKHAILLRNAVFNALDVAGAGA